MRSGARITGAGLVLGFALLGGSLGYAQIDNSSSPVIRQPDDPATEPAAPPAEAQQAEAELSAALYIPALRTLLQQGFDERGRNSFAASANLTVLSVPDGIAVYIATVEDIQASGGPDPVVEEGLFQPGNLVGNTPITIQTAPGDYVVGLRANKRGDGFDGGCVRKATRDAITGGVGRAYHLYGVTKRPGKYLCLLANFAPDSARPVDLGLPDGGIFSAGPEDLAGLIAGRTHVPEEQAGRVGELLLRTGRAFYDLGGTAYYCRLGIEGTDLTLQEWLVE